MLAIAVLALGTMPTGDGNSPAPAPQDDLRSYAGPVEPEPPNTPVAVGDPAPDFSFETSDHGWHRLHDLLAQGSVLLVFGASDDQLRSLETERGSMIARGVLPVAVLDRRDGAAWSTPARLKLHFNVIADSRGVIASQFNLEDGSTRRAGPGWFVVDRTGRVRALGRQSAPVAGYLAVAARALGLPGESEAMPAASH
jgi:peroxiredoxin